MTAAEFGGVDIDLLADYIGGALEGTGDESVVAALVSDDPAWREAYEALGGAMTAVASELAALPAEPMPDDLAARLDAWLAPDSPDSAPSRTSSDVGGGPRLALIEGAGSSSVPSSQPRPSTGRRRRWTAPIAVAAGLIAFVGFGLDYLSGRDHDGKSADSAAEAPGSAPRAAAGSGSGAFSPGTGRTFASGTDYSKATLAEQPVQPMTAPQLDGPSGMQKQSTGDVQGEAPALARLAGTQALTDCLAAIQQANGGGTIGVESVDYARYEGAPALIVRFTAANGRWVWASGPSCGTPESGADTLAYVPVG